MKSTIQTLWRARPRLVNNPVLSRELLVRLRMKSSFVYLAILLLVSFLFIVSWYPGFIEEYRTGTGWEDEIREWFMVLNLLQGLIVAGLVPLVSATIVNLEVERETWDLLISTPVSMASVVAGKFFSAVLYVWLMLTAMAPVYGIFFFIGAISVWEVLFIFALMTELVTIIGLMGILCSILCRRAAGAIGWTYALAALYVIGLPYLRLLAYALFGGPEVFGLEMLLSPMVAAVVFFINEPLPRGLETWADIHPVTAHFLMAGGLALLLAALCMAAMWVLYSGAGWTLSIFRREGGAGKTPGWIAGFRRAKALRFEDGQNPVRRRESHVVSMSRWHSLSNWMVTAFILFVIFTALQFGNPYDGSRILDIAKIGCFFALLLPVAAASFSANAIRGERDRSTMDLLLTTSLPPRTIVAGKAMAGVDSIRSQALCLFGPVFLFLCSFSLLIPDDAGAAWEVFLGSVCIGFVASYFFLHAGMLFSAWTGKTTAAYGLTFALGLFLYFGVILAVQIIGDLLDIPHPLRSVGLYPVMAVVSPFFLYIFHGFQVNAGPGETVAWEGAVWWTMICAQAAWMLTASAGLRWLTYKSLERDCNR